MSNQLGLLIFVYLYTIVSSTCLRYNLIETVGRIRPAGLQVSPGCDLVGIASADGADKCIAHQLIKVLGRTLHAGIDDEPHVGARTSPTPYGQRALSPS